MADLTVLNSDPLDSPSAFGDVYRVIKSGRVFDPQHIPI
jgi:imidazolonepropionase-like amidohydrolase